MLTKKEEIENKLDKCEVISLKIKAMEFINYQSFEYVQENYNVGEVYEILGVGYTVVTKKEHKKIHFVVIMKPEKVWEKHWQNASKKLEIKKGVYMCLFTGEHYTDKLEVPAFEPSSFKSGKEDLIINGILIKE